jgi:hypothetical protein
MCIGLSNLYRRVSLFELEVYLLSEKGFSFRRVNKRLSCEFDTRLCADLYERREKERKRNDKREGREKKIRK